MVSDLLVPIHDLEDDALPRVSPPLAVRRARPFELEPVARFVGERFGERWLGECRSAFGTTPPRCLVATDDRRLVGFCCYDVTARGFFGPLGVDEAMRGRGVGGALYGAALMQLRHLGFAYAIVGAAGDDGRRLYERVWRAHPIPDSFPGFFRDRLDVDGG